MELRTRNAISLTVVVPTLNSEATLDATLASLTADSRIRVIVADSFSSDRTSEICKRWNVEMIEVPAGNMYQAINAGLRLASTDWVAYVNSDDWVFTSSYVSMLDVATRGDADVVYGSADYVDMSGRFLFCTRPTRGDRIVKLLRSGIMAFCQPAAIFRRTVFEKLDGFNEQYRSAADLDFFCRAAMANLTFQRFEPQPVAAFRLHKGQISSKHAAWNRKEIGEMADRLGFDNGFASKWLFFSWRLANVPWYVSRALRSYELSRRFTLQKSTVPPLHD
jgi:glycosyltransferase involved in cell wall biosynthesis